MTGYRKSYPSRTFCIFDMPQHSTTCELKDDVPKRNWLDTVYNAAKPSRPVGWRVWQHMGYSRAI